MQVEGGDDRLTFTRLAVVPFPPGVRAIEHVMSRIAELAMSVHEAGMEAAKSGQIKWLKALLPQISIDKAAVARYLVEIGAAYGHCDVIEAAFHWAAHRDNGRERSSIAMEYAIHGGHLNAVECLLKKYKWNIRQALEQALRRDRQDIVGVLCFEASSREFLWAADQGYWQVVQSMHGIHELAFDDVYEALTTAASKGYLPIVQFLIEEAAACGHLEIVRFLLNTGSIQAASVDDALIRAAAGGHSTLVSFLHGNGADRASLLRDAFTEAATHGHSSVLRFLHGKGVVDPALFDESFVSAARQGHSTVVMFLWQNGGVRADAVLAEALRVAKEQKHARVINLLSSFRSARHGKPSKRRRKQRH